MSQNKFHINDKGQIKKCAAEKRSCKFQKYSSENISNFLTEERPDKMNSVLLYLKSKGFPAGELSPLEAIKQQLRSENNDKKHKLVDNAGKIDFKKVNLDKIKIRNKHYLNKVEPRPPIAESLKTESIAGVVYENQLGEYVLIDGYHRYKFLFNEKRKDYKYIVLSN